MSAASWKRLRKYFQMQLNLVVHPSRALAYGLAPELQIVRADEFLWLCFFFDVLIR